MKILLLEHPKQGLLPPRKAQLTAHAPLSASLMSGYCASALHDSGHEVHILYADLMGLSLRETFHLLERAPFDFLGLHLVYLWEGTESIFNMLESLKKSKRDGFHLFLFGYYPTSCHAQILEEYPMVDSIALGEPEAVVPQLAMRLEKGQCLDDLKGIARRQEQQVRANFPPPLVENFDGFPHPWRPEPELMKRIGPWLYILTSRGCPFQCAFCSLPSFHGRKWRARSPERVIEEIEGLVAQTGMKSFYFADANFLGPGLEGQQRALALADAIIASGLKIQLGFEARASSINGSILMRLKEAGLSHIFIGIESGSDNGLKNLNKSSALRDNLRAIEEAQKAGLALSMGFIPFEPKATLGDIKANFLFLKERGLLHSPTVTAHLLHHRLLAFRGTSAFSQLKKPLGFSFSQYEAYYTMEDSRAEALSQFASSLCQKALELVADSDFNPMTQRYEGAEGWLKEVNEVLTRSFEEALGLLDSMGVTAPLKSLLFTALNSLTSLEAELNSTSRREVGENLFLWKKKEVFPPLAPLSRKKPDQ